MGTQGDGLRPTGLLRGAKHRATIEGRSRYGESGVVAIQLVSTEILVGTYIPSVMASQEVAAQVGPQD